MQLQPWMTVNAIELEGRGELSEEMYLQILVEQKNAGKWAD